MMSTPKKNQPQFYVQWKDSEGTLGGKREITEERVHRSIHQTHLDTLILELKTGQRESIDTPWAIYTFK